MMTSKSFLLARAGIRLMIFNGFNQAVPFPPPN